MASSGLLTLPTQAQAQAQAQAEGRPATSAAVPARLATRAELQVLDFMQQYMDAVNGQHSEGKNAFTIRAEFLTPELDSALTQSAYDDRGRWRDPSSPPGQGGCAGPGTGQR
ncbi:hypothetical protein ACH4U5_09595 [Streptomyces sp. NPDC020858]|uniref:hypothetical protein n=1 Tax=Streptomyces sp. NPDC020858 TaxID=3365097 RepID=UPI0037ABCB60